MSVPPVPSPTPDSSEAPVKRNYKDTLNLPQTAFPMEAKLVANEPARLKRWQEGRLYEKLLAARAKDPKWILHDGPPFANSDIHIGHVLNKVLKDVFMRYKTMAGFQTPYVPGWDCHGLPIEHKITQDLGSKAREMSKLDIRKLCHAHAQKYADVQSVQFQRLGILGEWSNPYMTMKPEYEAETLEVFARFVEAGLVYKQLKPVQWSIANQTALADAELEYKDVEDNSVFVEFAVANPGAFKSKFDIKENAKVSFLIWTTTPWTLPANMAIAVHPDVDYALVKYDRNGDAHVSVVAKDLVERLFSNRGAHTVLKTVVGRELVGEEYRHPFIDRGGTIVHAEYVTTTDGTGLVHTAPGHGEDDYHTGIANGIEVYCPVLGNGRFDTTAPEWLQGKTVWESNPLVTTKLKELDVLFAEQKLVHSYPHDWRSKTPTIFRATEQWFIALDKTFTPSPLPTLSQRTGRGLQSLSNLTPSPSTLGEGRGEGQALRARALNAIESVEFVPSWGQARIKGMLDSRPDWCISRQRAWGLPIPVFYNEKDEPLLTPASVRAVAKHFKMKGSDAWFTSEPSELLGADFVYPDGFSATNLRKEKDIFDVWFESGSSWHAVLQCRSYLNFPADLYLEGSDQHRGWFQLSMLPALGATGVPPFKQVLTHGFIVKPDGTKVSKSDKEYVTATQEVERHGADLLRLFVSSVDYQGDIPASPQGIKEFGDKYRKIRNTLRFLLSNLSDFDPRMHAQDVPPNSLDGWALAELDQLIADVREGYEAYQLHRVFRALHDFCAVQVSAIYAAAMKDRLYCDAIDAPLRRRAQTVMHRMSVVLTKLLAPILVFTADEAWEYIQHKPQADRDLDSVHLALFPQPSGAAPTEASRGEWKLLMELRDSAMKQVDALSRKFPKQIKPLDLEVVFTVDDDTLRRKLQAYGPDLEDLIGAGSHSFAESGRENSASPGNVVGNLSGSVVGNVTGTATVEVVDRRETYKACARSWKRRADVGSDAEYPDLTLRDANAVRSRAAAS